MKALITKFLNLPGVIVEDSKEIEETLILSVKVEKKTAVERKIRKSQISLSDGGNYA